MYLPSPGLGLGFAYIGLGLASRKGWVGMARNHARPLSASHYERSAAGFVFCPSASRCTSPAIRSDEGRSHLFLKL